MLTRRVERDGNRYFGPFTSSSAVRETLDLLRRTFPYRTCGREITGKDHRACLYYDLKLCLAPCIGVVSQEEYRAAIAGLIRFLEGHGEEVLADLERRMREAADRLEFERAAVLRDQLRAARQLLERQKIVAAVGADQDVIAFARSDGDACVQVFFIRDGKLLGREYFLLEGAEAEEDREVLTAFLKQFYEDAAYVPQEVLLPEEVEEARVIEEWLRSRRGSKVVLRVPRRGRGRDLVRMAAENAAQMLETLRAQWQADSHRQEQALEELRVALGLPNRPSRIEGYDVSTTQGVEPTASMVVLEQGVLRKSDYRRFALRTLDRSRRLQRDAGGPDPTAGTLANCYLRGDDGGARHEGLGAAAGPDRGGRRERTVEHRAGGPGSLWAAGAGCGGRAGEGRGSPLRPWAGGAHPVADGLRGALAATATAG